MMFTRLAVAAASVATLFAGVQAQDAVKGLDIYSPGGSDQWWVASSINIVSWTCQTSPIQNFSVVLANQDATKWAPFTIIAIENNFDCSKTITADQQNAPAGSGYLMQFANPLNSTQIYATSEPFEIKAIGSAYPATTAVPPGASNTASAGPSGSGSGSGSAGSPQSTGTAQKPSGAVKTSAAGLFVAGAAALGFFLA